MSLKTKNEHFYESSYESLLLRGTDDISTPRPWDLFSEIKKYTSIEQNLLDIGCGTAFKLLPFSLFLSQIIGIDISQSMLLAAKKNIETNNIENIQLIQATSERIPILNNSIDITVSMLGRWDVKEIARVTKKNGIVIIEHIGCEDKKDFKKFFAKDQLGWRGQYLEFSRKKYIDTCYRDFLEYFTHVRIINGFWNTYYTTEGLKILLSNTPTIRNYDENKDKNFLSLAIKNLETPNGIKLQQNRMLIYATNTPSIIS